MAEDSWKALKASFDVLHDYSEEKAQKITKMESKVDRYEDELGTYLVQLNNKDLSETDSHSVSMMLHCIGDFERISDHAVNIKESADELLSLIHIWPERRWRITVSGCRLPEEKYPVQWEKTSVPNKLSSA